MSRAIRPLFLVLVCLALLPSELRAQAQPVNLVNGIGLIDYSRKPNLKVGGWVKYRMAGSSEMGMKDDYEVTILIAGEERFWGEECFWVETWTHSPGRPPAAVATLMSYGIFQDSLAIPRLQLFSRKTISDVDPWTGIPSQVVNKRGPSSMKSRKPPGSDVAWSVDTIGAEQVTVPRGTFNCHKVLMKQGVASSTDVGDSTIRTEVREDRTLFMTLEVPITSLAREDIDHSIKRRVWQIGRSQDDPERVMDHAQGSAVLVDYGVGLAPQLVPERNRSTIREQERSSRPAAKPAGKARSRG